MVDEVKVTRRYQVTIPESVRSKLGVKIGDKLIVKSENKRIIMESPRRISNPSEQFGAFFAAYPVNIDVAKLVEDSWKERLIGKRSCEQQSRDKLIELLIDTNIFVYSALAHPIYGKSCKQIIDDIQNEKIKAICGFLVPNRTFRFPRSDRPTKSGYSD